MKNSFSYILAGFGLSLALTGICLAQEATPTPTATPVATAAPTKTPVSSCKKIVNMRAVPANGRGGSLIWKSNWNSKANREQTFYEGNHSQKGAGFLVHYLAGRAYMPSTFTIQIKDAKCSKVIGTMGRFPRCTNMGCGEHERWYLRTVGGSRQTIATLAGQAKRAGGSYSVLIQLRNGYWAKVSSVYSNREIAN